MLNSLEYPYAPWMRIASSEFSDAASVATSLAMPASLSQRRPWSYAVAAASVRWRAASRRVAMSASLIWIAWGSQIGFPEGLGHRAAADGSLGQGRGRGRA